MKGPVIATATPRREIDVRAIVMVVRDARPSPPPSARRKDRAGGVGEAAVEQERVDVVAESKIAMDRIVRSPMAGGYRSSGDPAGWR